MQPLTQIQIGTLVFSGVGVPEKIPAGGAQMSGVHQLPDGVRVVDAMGPNDSDLAWEGLLFDDPTTGTVASDQAAYLDLVRKQGNPVTLSWDVYGYTVLVARFEWSFERYFQISYTIRCIVIADLTAPVGSSSPGTVNDYVNGDMANVLTSGQNLGMTVPPSFPGPFSTTIGASLPTSPIITWLAPAS